MQTNRYRVIQGIVSVAKEPPIHVGYGRTSADGERNSATTQLVRQGEFLPEHVSQAVINELLSQGLIVETNQPDPNETRAAIIAGQQSAARIIGPGLTSPFTRIGSPV